MAIATQVVRMTEAQIAESGRVLARAFEDDPLMNYILADESKRATALPWFMTKGATYGHKYGEVYTTSDTIAGNAVWLPPGETKMPMSRMIATGMLLAPFKFGMKSFGRFNKVISIFDHLHEEAVPEKHWYLMLLGVDPPRQGQGVGGALIQPILARADADRLPCYLETQKQINVPFYQRHGFAVVVESDLPDNGPHYWTMKRPARA